MKRITFLIGNGFDLNVGLNTRYLDFYKYYIKEHPYDMLAESIGKDYACWSDLEVGLGKYTSQVNEEKEKEFWDSERILEEELASYLEKQMKRVDGEREEKKREIALQMTKTLQEFYVGLPQEQREYISRYIDKTRDEIVYSFITFNYTNILEKCLGITKNIIRGNLINCRVNRGAFYEDTIGTVTHIHGTTSKEMVLGVNDSSQIFNERFRRDSLCRQYLIKNEINRGFGEKKVDDAHKIIDESMIICVFGMSIGQTDKMWWRHIGEWLCGNKNRRLIIYFSDDKLKRGNTKYQLFPNRNQILTRLKENSGMDMNKWKVVEKQIYTGCGNKIFNFNLV